MDQRLSGQPDLEARAQYGQDNALLAQMTSELKQRHDRRMRGRKATYVALEQIRANRALYADAPWYLRWYYRIKGV
jgi:hypothetical protein